MTTNLPLENVTNPTIEPLAGLINPNVINTATGYPNGTYYSTAFGVPFNNYATPCTNDSYYNCPPPMHSMPPMPPMHPTYPMHHKSPQHRECKKKCKKNRHHSSEQPVTGHNNGHCGPCGQLNHGQNNPCIPPKDPCPLKSFCDPGLINSVLSRPLINPNTPRRAVPTWKINYLVANTPGRATNVDEDLVNPWGMILFNNLLIVANSRSDTITSYDIFGNKLYSIIARDVTNDSSHPTGLAINVTSNFPITRNTTTRSADLLCCTDQGTLLAYNQVVDPLNTVVIQNQQLVGEVSKYKGLAIVNGILYLADFFGKQIDVYDSFYNRLSNYHFIDTDISDPIPSDYGPNNIVNIGPFLYIVWARQDPSNPLHAIDGPGNGYISVFNLDGSFVRRFTSKGVLNSPWAMIPAPCECGFPPGSFLVGNNGDGRINVFDCNGRYVGPVLSSAGLPIILYGLRSLVPHYTDFNEIFFTMSVDADADGQLGSLVRDQIIYL